MHIDYLPTVNLGFWQPEPIFVLSYVKLDPFLQIQLTWKHIIFSEPLEGLVLWQHSLLPASDPLWLLKYWSLQDMIFFNPNIHPPLVATPEDISTISCPQLSQPRFFLETETAPLVSEASRWSDDVLKMPWRWWKKNHGTHFRIASFRDLDCSAHFQWRLKVNSRGRWRSDDPWMWCSRDRRWSDQWIIYLQSTPPFKYHL